MDSRLFILLRRCGPMVLMIRMRIQIIYSLPLRTGHDSIFAEHTRGPPDLGVIDQEALAGRGPLARRGVDLESRSRRERTPFSADLKKRQPFHVFLSPAQDLVRSVENTT